MSLELYVGPMFSGKTTKALEIIENCEKEGIPAFCITSNIDVRYAKDGGEIVSHNRISHYAISVENLYSVIYNNDFKVSEYIIIDEAQFFPDLKKFVLECVEKYGKTVVCFGLDGDSDREKFGQILDLIPHCDSITKLLSLIHI